METEVSVDDLAQIIRRVDGENKLGAGALAEAILASLPIKAGEAVPVGWMVVPREPTEAMREAFYGSVIMTREGSAIGFNLGYQAMVAASPQPEAYGVMVKPLEWSSEPPYSVARVPRLRLLYSTESVWNDSKFCYVELSGGLASGRFETVEAAKAAAQADYEARILSALSHTEQGETP